MSIQAINWVLTEVDDATGNDLLVLIALANHADQYGVCWPSVGLVAREINCSPRTVQRSIQTLTDAGRISVVPQGAVDSRIRSDRRPNLYQLERGDRLSPRDGVTDGDGVTEQVERGDNAVVNGVTRVSPKPSLEPSMNLSSSFSSYSTEEEENFNPEQTINPQPALDTSRMNPLVVEAASLIADRRLTARQKIDPPVVHPGRWREATMRDILEEHGPALTKAADRGQTDPNRIAALACPAEYGGSTRYQEFDMNDIRQQRTSATATERAAKIRAIKETALS